MINRTVAPFLFMLLAAAPVWAQTPVSVREINEIPQAQIDFLNATGAALTTGDITTNIFNALVGQQVEFTAVLLSDPRSSGLANINADGFPSRIHFFVRDTLAALMGTGGMGIQVVSAYPDYLTNGLLDLVPGDVVDIIGHVAPFMTSMQLTLETITFLGTIGDLGLPNSILDPVVITTADANENLGGNQVQVNWDTLATFRGQYVRLENATVVARDVSSSRPNWLVSTDGDRTVLNFYDISLRFRNDRAGDYPPSFNVRDFEFVPPPLGAEIYIQGFLVFQSDDPFARGIPDGALLSIVPFEDSDIPATRFVDPSGSDGGNDCTDISNPCQTISHAASMSSDFDSLVIEAGTYTEPGLLITKRLNIAAQSVIVQ